MMSARKRLSVMCLIDLIIFYSIILNKYSCKLETIQYTINSAYTLTMSNEKYFIARYFSYIG